MKKRIITLTLALVMLMPLMTPAVYAEDLLESKAVYYTEESDYIEGDCILTATKMMIRSLRNCLIGQQLLLHQCRLKHLLPHRYQPED